MGFNFGRGSRRASSSDTPTASIDSPQRTDPEKPAGANEPIYDDDRAIQCPPHTTERKLVTKIDFRVIPFLCIMYLLAFLGKPSPHSLYKGLRLTIAISRPSQHLQCQRFWPL